MKFKRLAIENLGPYLGRHTLDLDVPETSPVVLVHGENMRGKTSLFNAIRWVLYGQTVGRRGRSLPSLSLLSYDALEAGDFHFLVELDFEHEGMQYQLERQVQSARRPMTEHDLVPTVRLRRDGHILATEDISHIISDILHPDISRFFLFDGEMLNQYEILLGEPGRDSQIVRQSIEQILGLPALQLLVDDLASARRETEQQLLRSAELARKNESAVASARQITASVEALEADLQRLNGMQSKLVVERDGLADRLAGFGEINADLRELERIEGAIKRHGDERDRAKATCQDTIRESWWLPISTLARDRLQTLRTRAEELGLRIDLAADLRARLSNAKRASEHALCETCGQPIDAERRAKASALAAELQQDLDQLDTPAKAFGDTLAEQRAIEPYADTSPFGRLSEAEASFRRAGIEIRRVTHDAEAIRDRLKAHDRAEISAIEIQYEQCVRQLVDVESKLADGAIQFADQKGSLGRIQARIAQTPGTDPRIGLRSTVYASLAEIFESAVDRFREELRLQVETEASAVFRAITTEPDYAGLSINENYGLTIIDGTGRAIRERSAGAEQVVALSLIGGLNRSATRTAPVVMDTPFGRLDTKHRENILRFVPTLAGQVVMLVQSGELDRSRDLTHLEGAIGREFRIARDGPTQSHFEVVS